MEIGLLSAILIGLLFALLASGVWVAISLLFIGFFAISMLTSVPVGRVMATTFWGQSWSWALTALPLFIWMGEILFRTRLASDMFQGLAPWMRRIPGRLLHTNVAACGIFAAVSGSSAATTATIGRITIPELLKRGYDEKLSLGSLAGSSTLGFLIPPSIILIVYGVAADVSITRLFMAGVFPGILLMLLFSGCIVLLALARPGRVPPPEPSISFSEKISRSWRLFPIALLILAVLGSIYAGLATATESAVLGVVGALVISAATGSLTWESFADSVMGATRTSCMIAFILASAAFVAVAMGFTGIPRVLAVWISEMNLSPTMLIFALTIFFVVLGCFLDGLSIIVLTSAILLPMVQAAGIDLIWFGIYLVIVIEISQITPPIGFNLFVIQGLTGRNIIYIAQGALPFFLVLLIMVGILMLLPDLATWLPSQMDMRR